MAKDDKPFYYKIIAAEFLAEVFQIPEGKHKEWLSQFALDLVSANGSTDYSRKIINEVNDYRAKQAENGRKGGKVLKKIEKAPLSDPQAPLSDPQATHKPEAEAEAEAEAEEKKKEKTLDGEKIPPCPHQKIVSLYNEKLPTLTRVKEKLWNGARANNLQARWREDEERQTEQWWADLFDSISGMPFLLGESERKWKADLGWIVEKRNLVKIIEGKYLNNNQQYDVNGWPIK